MTLEIAWAMAVGAWWGIAIGIVVFLPILVIAIIADRFVNR